MCKTLRAPSFDRLASAVLECRADGYALFVDACVAGMVPSSATKSGSRVTVSLVNVSSMRFLFDFGLYRRGSLCVRMVVDS